MLWAKGPYGIEEAQSHCDNASQNLEARVGYDLLMTTKHDGELIGGCSFVDPIDWGTPCFEIGYWVHTAYVGHGYASEATRALTRLAFESFGAKRVELRMDTLNVRSWGVAEQLGFQLVETLIGEGLDNEGDPGDTRVYALHDLDDLRGS